MEDDDDKPLAMLPASTSAARHTAPSAEQTPAGPARQLPQLSNPVSSDIPDALPAFSSTPGEQSDMPAAGQSMQVKTALLPSMQHAASGATDLPATTSHRGDTGPLDAAERTDNAVSVPSSAAALPSAEARQAVGSSPAKVKGSVTQGRHDPPQPAVSMQERQANMASGVQAVSDPGKRAEAGSVDNPQPTDHQNHLVSDSESEGPSGKSLPHPVEGMPGCATDTAAPEHTSAVITLEAAGDAAPSPSPCHTQQQPQQQHSSNDPAAGDGCTVVDSSVSLLQAEAEAARLAVLLAPPVYRTPALAHQLACMGTGLPVQNTSTSCTQAPLHAQSGSPQPASMATDKALPAEVQSGACKSRIAEAESLEAVQSLQAAGGLPTLLGAAQLPGHSRQDSLQQENAEVAASSGLQQLAMQVNQCRLKNCGDLEAVNEGPASSFEQEDMTMIYEEDAADVVIPDR